MATVLDRTETIIPLPAERETGIVRARAAWLLRDLLMGLTYPDALRRAQEIVDWQLLAEYGSTGETTPNEPWSMRDGVDPWNEPGAEYDAWRERMIAYKAAKRVRAERRDRVLVMGPGELEAWLRALAGPEG